MSKWVLVPEGITEAVDAAKDFYELYKRTVVSGCTPMEQLRFVAALKFFESMLNAAPQTEANARLIAAAPELLAFVEEYIDAFENGMAGESYLHRIAKTAITKATGETV